MPRTKEPKQYRVAFSYNVYGDTIVNATSEEDAENQVEERLNDNGLKGLNGFNFNLAEALAQDAEVIEDGN